VRRKKNVRQQGIMFEPGRETTGKIISSKNPELTKERDSQTWTNCTGAPLSWEETSTVGLSRNRAHTTEGPHKTRGGSRAGVLGGWLGKSKTKKPEGFAYRPARVPFTTDLTLLFLASSVCPPVVFSENQQSKAITQKSLAYQCAPARRGASRMHPSWCQDM